MDREELKKQLQRFLDLSKKEGKPLKIVRLDDALPGLPGNGYIVHLLAPWAADMSFGEAMDLVLDWLWQTTDVALRTEISSLNIQPGHEDVAAYLRYGGWG